MDAQHGQASADFVDLLRRRAATIADHEAVVERVTAQRRRQVDGRSVVERQEVSL